MGGEKKKPQFFSHLGSGKDVEWNKIEIGNDGNREEREKGKECPAVSIL